MADIYKLRPRLVEALRYDEKDPAPAYGFLGMPADCERLALENAADCWARGSWATGYGRGDDALPAILSWRGGRRGFALSLKGRGGEAAVRDGMWLVRGSGGWSAMTHDEFSGKYEPAGANTAAESGAPGDKLTHGDGHGN